MLVKNLSRSIDVIDRKVRVTTDSIIGGSYAYYLIFHDNVEKKFYSNSSSHEFNMLIEDGDYECVFYYKINNETYHVKEYFEVRNGNVAVNIPSFWDQSILDVRDLRRWRRPVYEYEYLYHFFNKKNMEKGIHSISYNGIPIDINIDIKNQDVLFVFFNGASPRGGNMKLPVFSGLGVIPENANIICINDPTLYVNEELCLAWYSGSKWQNIQKILLKIILHIIQVSGCHKSVFVGGSGGGFASLFYSRKVKNSMAIVWNAQTDIARYVPKFVSDYASYAFSSDRMDDSYDDLKLQINMSLLEEYDKGFDNAIFYMQNKSDWHLNEHCLPFIESLQHTDSGKVIKNLKKYLQLQIGDWGKGHEPPPKEVISSLLKIIKDNEHEKNEDIIKKLSEFFEKLF